MSFNKNCRKKIEQREIKISDVFFFILSRWKSIVITSLVFIMVFNGIYFVRNIKSDRSNLSGEVSEEYLTEEEKENVENIKMLKSQLASLISYKNDSELMKINAYVKYEITLQYSIDSMKEDRGTISEVYRTFVTRGNLVNEIAPKLNMKEKVLEELITVPEIEKERVDDYRTTLEVKITHSEKKKCNQIAKLVDKTMKEQKFKALSSEYHLIMLSKSSKVGADSELQKKQNDIFNFISAKKTEIKTLESTLSPNAKLVLEQKQNGKSQVQKKENKIFSLKYSILGISFGILLMCMLYFFRYIHDSSLKHAYELSDIFELKLFGCLSEQVIAEILLFCKKNKIDKLYISTNFRNNNIQILENVLNEEGIRIDVGDSILMGTSNLEKAVKAGNLLLVEKVGISEYYSIALEIEKCKNLDINILGAAVIN